MGDLVAASHDRGTLTIIWGGGAGLDGQATTWSIGSEVADVVVADLDADGHLDIATALPNSDAVAVLRGRGHRSFAGPGHHAAGSVPRALIATDLDGAAPPELITADLGGGSVTVLRGLVAAAPVIVGPGPHGLVAGDFDGDSDIDLAVAIADDNAVQVMVGDGEGGLLPGPRHIVGNAPYGVVAADFDGDGVLDIASANALDDTVSVLWGDGVGALRGRATWPTVSEPEALVVVPRPDALPVLGVLSRVTSTVQFVDPRDGVAVAGATAERATAIMADGLGSLLYASDTAGRVGSMSPGTGLRLMPMWTGPQVPSAWPVDLEGDNIDELLVVEPGSKFGDLQLWRGGPTSSTSVMTGLTAITRGAKSGELTGDSRRDVVIWSSESLVVLIQQPSSLLLALSPPSAFPNGIQDVVLGDADGDGAQELLVLSGSAAKERRLQGYSVDASGALNLMADIPLDISANTLRIVDGGGDGRTDLVFGGPGEFFYLEDISLPLRVIELEESAELGALALRDVNGDGSPDAFYCSDGGLFYILDLLGDSPAAPVQIDNDRCETVDLHDLDGDGAIDLLVQATDRNFDSQRILFTPWLREPAGWTLGGAQSVLTHPFASLQLAQLDADGTPDILLTGFPFIDTAAIRRTSGPALVEAAGPRLDDTLRFRFGDIDGDGATDLIGFSQNLAVALADREGSFGSLFSFDRAIAFGSPEAVVQDLVVADFVRDGADEVVVAISAPDIVGVKILSLAFGAKVDVSREELAVLPNEQVMLHVADLDRDTNLDLVVLGVGSQLDAFVFLGTGQGHFAAPRATSGKSPTEIRRTELFDMDGDGHLDVLGAADDGAVVFPGLGGDSFAKGRYWATVAGQLHLPGDFDDDGLVDLAVLNDGELRILVGANPDGDANVALSSLTALAMADLDGDGRLELLAAGDLPQPLAATKLLYVGHADQHDVIFDEFEVPAGPASALSVSDFDGDGDEDILWIDDGGVTVVRQEP